VRWLKILLALNGAAFVLYGVMNLITPDSWYVAKGAPANEVDLARMIGILLLGLGVIQLGAWILEERLAVEMIAGVSLLLMAGWAAFGFTIQGSTYTDSFHTSAVATAAAYAVYAVLYAVVLYRERMAATA